MLSPTTGEQQCTTEVRQRSFSAHMARVVDDALPDRIKWPRMSPHAQHAQMGLTCLLISHYGSLMLITLRSTFGVALIPFAPHKSE